MTVSLQDLEPVAVAGIVRSASIPVFKPSSKVCLPSTFASLFMPCLLDMDK